MPTNKGCKYCCRWYSTGADQCDIPNPGFQMTEKFSTALGNKPPSEKDVVKMQFLKDKLTFIHFNGENKIFGHPSEMNLEHDCPFFKGAPLKTNFLLGLWRMFY